MPLPTTGEIILKYLITILHYWWALLPGLVMPLRNIYKWLHPKHRELEIPHWVRIGSVLAALSFFLPQFLPYQTSAQNLPIVTKVKSNFTFALKTQSPKLQNLKHDLDFLKTK